MNWEVTFVEYVLVLNNSLIHDKNSSYMNQNNADTHEQCD